VGRPQWEVARLVGEELKEPTGEHDRNKYHVDRTPSYSRQAVAFVLHTSKNAHALPPTTMAFAISHCGSFSPSHLQEANRVSPPPALFSNNWPPTGKMRWARAEECLRALAGHEFSECERQTRWVFVIPHRRDSCHYALGGGGRRRPRRRCEGALTKPVPCA